MLLFDGGYVSFTRTGTGANATYTPAYHFYMRDHLGSNRVVVSAAGVPDTVRELLPRLEKLDFIKEHRNIVLYGNPGTGKTHIATGIALKACMEGRTVMFTSVPHLITQIKECKSSKTLHQLELRFKKYDLVVCDEFGYVSCDKEAGELLFNHLSLRADLKSTIITTNLAFDRWGEVIRDKVLVAAMVDRLTHNAYLINMNGESYRLKETRKFNGR